MDEWTACECSGIRSAGAGERDRTREESADGACCTEDKGYGAKRHGGHGRMDRFPDIRGGRAGNVKLDEVEL